MASGRASLLTQGLEPLGTQSPQLQRMLTQLYELDDQLQAAHRHAKQDDEFGEDVVQKYRAFLAFRDEFVQALQSEGVAVPWQLRMRIDDLELTLKQREEKASGSAKTKSKTTAQATKKQPKEQRDAGLLSPAALCSATTNYLAPAVLVLVLAFIVAQYVQQYIHGM